MEIVVEQKRINLDNKIITELENFHKNSASLYNHNYKSVFNVISVKDVNDVLKRLRAQDYGLAQSFVSKALDVYFTHPDVISALSMGRTTLFPNERILEDIDYNLLDQVVNQNLGGFRDQQD